MLDDETHEHVQAPRLRQRKAGRTYEQRQLLLVQRQQRLRAQLRQLAEVVDRLFDVRPRGVLDEDRADTGVYRRCVRLPEPAVDDVVAEQPLEDIEGEDSGVVHQP
jgi:hypothetical protein